MSELEKIVAGLKVEHDTLSEKIEGLTQEITVHEGEIKKLKESKKHFLEEDTIVKDAITLFSKQEKNVSILAKLGLAAEVQVELYKKYPEVMDSFINYADDIQPKLEKIVDAGGKLDEMITSLGDGYIKTGKTYCKNTTPPQIPYVAEKIFDNDKEDSRFILNDSGYSFKQQMQNYFASPSLDYILNREHKIVQEFVNRGLSIDDISNKDNENIIKLMLEEGSKNWEHDITKYPVMVLADNGLPIVSQFKLLENEGSKAAMRTMLEHPKDAVKLKDGFQIPFSEQLADISSYEQIGSSSYYWPLEYLDKGATQREFYDKHKNNVKHSGGNTAKFQKIIDEGMPQTNLGEVNVDNIKRFAGRKVGK